MVDDDLLLGLRALAAARKVQGDHTLVLSPDPTIQEMLEVETDIRTSIGQGLVLEPQVNASLEIRDIKKRRQCIDIKAFCDGIRSTYFIGFEDAYPILYTRNASAIRTRDEKTGYHTLMYNLQQSQAMLLAPFDLFRATTRSMYEQLGLYTGRHADLCWTGLDYENAPSFPEMQRMGAQSWTKRARRRARSLLDVSEQITSLAGARILREQDPTGKSWLLKDGALHQFRQEYLHQVEPLRNIVSCVKTHPVSFFGVEGESKIRQLEVGQRSVAFLPRPLREAQKNVTLRHTDRPLISWYLRVCPSNAHHSNPMSGIIRLDIAAIEDWQNWIDEVSWAVLDEFYGLSAMPDPRADVMPYGIYDCEQFLKSQLIPGELLLAQLR